MVQYEPMLIKIYKCIENVKTRWDNKKLIIVIVIIIQGIYLSITKDDYCLKCRAVR